MAVKNTLIQTCKTIEFATVISTLLSIGVLVICLTSVTLIYSEVSSLWFELDYDMDEFKTLSNELWTELKSVSPLSSSEARHRRQAIIQALDNQGAFQPFPTGDYQQPQQTGPSFPSHNDGQPAQVLGPVPLGSLEPGSDKFQAAFIPIGPPSVAPADAELPVQAPSFGPADNLGYGFPSRQPGPARPPGIEPSPVVIEEILGLPGAATFAGNYGQASQGRPYVQRLPPGCNCNSLNLCPSGLPGLPGVAGEPGSDGYAGQPGLAGKDALDVFPQLDPEVCHFCPPGRPGKPGFAGKPGKAGVRGPDGKLGMPGTNSSPGRPGLQGSRGPQGLLGLPGQRGAPGLSTKRIMGLPGSKGLPGFIGLAGEKGHNGFPGIPGIVGLQGSIGFSGGLGNPGPFGPQGLAGIHGGPGNDANYCPCPKKDQIIQPPHNYFPPQPTLYEPHPPQYEYTNVDPPPDFPPQPSIPQYIPLEQHFEPSLPASGFGQPQHQHYQNIGTQQQGFEQQPFRKQQR